MPTCNQLILAKLASLNAINKARMKHQDRSSSEQVMSALKEAIDAKRQEVAWHTMRGEGDTEAARLACKQLSDWTSAWKSNR